LKNKIPNPDTNLRKKVVYHPKTTNARDKSTLRNQGLAMGCKGNPL